MPVRQAGDKSIEVDQEGCFVNKDDWTPEIFMIMGGKEGLNMTKHHLMIARHLRSLNGKSADLFVMTSELEKIVSWPQFLKLFPGGHRHALKLSGCKIHPGI